MADTKISALGSAAPLAGTELLVAVQGGVDVKTTTQDVADLSAGFNGVYVIPTGGTAHFDGTTFGGAIQTWTDAGVVQMNLIAGSTWVYSNAGTMQGQIVFGTTGLGFVAYNGFGITINTNSGGAVVWSDTFNTFSVAGFTGTSYQLTGQTPGYWGGPGTPVLVEVAIDRLANAVSGGGATPIP